MPAFEIEVNGERLSVDVAEDTPLLFVLRNDLGLKGAKLGCGTGHCGACMVSIDGNAVNSCTAPMWSVAGRAVLTLEGCGEDAAFRSFLRLQAAQCGYCIPGIMMTARVLLSKNPRISDEDIIAALSERHLCRCGAHTRILKAIAEARDAS